MRFFLITDNADAGIGLRLAGIEYALIKNEEECRNTLDEILRDKTVGIILITQGTYEKYAALIDETKRSTALPLITEIPDDGASFKSDAITRYVAEAVGVG